MRELMLNCLYVLVTVLSVLGTAAAVLILVGMVRGVIDAINHHGGHHGA